MQILFEPSDKSFYEHPAQYFRIRIPWKNHRLCQKQFLSQNNGCPFSQFWKVGWFLIFRYVKTLCHWDYLFRSSTHRKACFLHCRWYDGFKDKAFVTDFASDFLCDCWYVSEKTINTFAQKGFQTIGALKTNRLLYPSGMKKKLSELATELSVTHNGFDLVIVKKRKYYVYRYEGNLNGIENAVVLFSYPEKAFGNSKALRAFIRTNVALSTQDILSFCVCRWPIEIFSASVKISWLWIAIRYALRRESKGTGYLCHWHISCV